ncbi:unnamed protein product [Meloidogyne enterolobii]|uniref:Uncharacterized protein n=1 Tax=Meloidogyne enterolobii TaxID=390850 RepID=A0ACB0Y8R6_MELEN
MSKVYYGRDVITESPEVTESIESIMKPKGGQLRVDPEWIQRLPRHHEAKPSYWMAFTAAMLVGAFAWLRRF